MNEPVSLFPHLPMQCPKSRRYSTDRNGRYVLACQKNAGHAGPCDHRWGIDTRTTDTGDAA